MQKPNNYDEVQIGGFRPLLEGGHILVIQEVEELQSKNGRDMVKVSFDTAADDIQPEYYLNLWKNDDREDKKWRGVRYVMVYDMDDNTSRDFKAFCTSVEESNEGFTVQWGADFGSQFKGLRVGGIAGRVLDAYNGKEIKKTEIRFWRSVASADGAAAPEEYETPAHTNFVQPTEFMQISDEDLPFV